MKQNSSSDLYLDELPVWRIIRIDGQLVSSINSAIIVFERLTGVNRPPQWDPFPVITVYSSLV